MAITPTTITAPEAERPPALDALDVITAIRQHGRHVEYAVLANRSTFTVGSSPTCSMYVPRKYVSALHCVLERHGPRLRVQDQNSRNGTFFRGHRETSFDIVPGDTFIVGTTTLLALNEYMRSQRPVMEELLGYDCEADIDDILIASVQDGPMLVVGPEGAGFSRLVGSIHEVSIRRERPLVQLERVPSAQDQRQRLLVEVHRGTLTVVVADRPIDSEFLQMVRSPEYHVRLVLVGPSMDAVSQLIGLDALTRMSRVEIRPLRDRAHEIDTLFDSLFVENRFSMRFKKLTARNQEALRAYTWPNNNDELREAAIRIVAIAREPSLRKAAAVLETPRSTLRSWFERVKLTLPLATLTLREGLAKTDQSNADKQRDLSVSYNNLGDVAVRAGKLEEARAWYSKALTLREGLAKMDQSNADKQRELCITLVGLATATQGSRKAIEHLRRARSIYDRLKGEGAFLGDALFAHLGAVLREL